MSNFSFGGQPPSHPSRSAATVINFEPEASNFAAGSFSFPQAREFYPEHAHPTPAYHAHLRTSPSTSRIRNDVPPSPHAHAFHAHRSRRVRTPASSPPPTSAILCSNGVPPDFADTVANALGYSDQDNDLRQQLHGFVEVTADLLWPKTHLPPAVADG
jgi:hypothetical protein